MNTAHPILTCAEAQTLEERLLGSDEKRIWEAMCKAGAGVGAGVLRDFPQLRPLPRNPRVLVLAGPGHNGGDALLAAVEILRARPRAKVTAVFEGEFKPLAKKALDELLHHECVECLTFAQFLAQMKKGESWDIVIDGLYGMSFRPPLPAKARELLKAFNENLEVAAFRAAVDLPSGLNGTSATLAFHADFTYATGIAKTPLFDSANAKWVGRIRYVDIGFFDGVYVGPHESSESLITPNILEPLRRLRPATADKRMCGRLLVISGSHAYPGAQMLNVLGALRAGAGLVTALTPATHAGAFAAARPEAMWHACAEESDGCHGAATLAAAREVWPRATAVLAGSGLGKSPHAQAMLDALVTECPLPMVLDADALTKATLEALKERPKKAGAVVLTPHAGEFERLAGKGADLRAFCRKHRVVTVLKGPVTRVCDGDRVWCSTFGGPVLARGGSGDVLAGIAGTLLAQTPDEPFMATARAVVWQGLAADALAHERGETAALTAEIPTHMPAALRGEWGV